MSNGQEHDKKIAEKKEKRKPEYPLNLWNKSVEPKNESLDDTLAIDMPNYVGLTKECYIDFKRRLRNEGSERSHN